MIKIFEETAEMNKRMKKTMVARLTVAFTLAYLAMILINRAKCFIAATPTEKTVQKLIADWPILQLTLPPLSTMLLLSHTHSLSLCLSAILHSFPLFPFHINMMSVSKKVIIE
jgi:hypothetical protein